MKSWLAAIILLVCHTCIAQTWMGEVSVGGMGYCGDLTQKGLSLKRIRPAAGLSIRYESGDLMNFRVGGVWGILTADDKDNPEPTLSVRNLNFTTQLIEGNAILEFNLFDPEIFTSYPYIYAGAGMFYFNSYTFDNDNKKVYLHKLNTEGQGLAEYPDRKQYKMTQICLPIGMGWKWVTKNRTLMSVEFGYRVTFTDYIDDVSKTYVDPEILALQRGQLSADMSFRKLNAPFQELGQPRGNPDKKDIYFFGCFKYSFPFSKKKKADKAVKPVAETKEKKGKGKKKKG